ncbi:MAG: hypothetical protein ACLTDS_12215 [Bianqueaceae bacterium]
MSMTRYAPSGKFSAVGLIGMIFGGLLGAFIFGTVYIYLMNYFSNMVLRLIIIGGLIAGMSQWMIFLMRIGKIRRPVLAVGITALSLLFLLYSKWAVYVNMVQEIWKSTDKVWYANLAMPGFFETWWDTVTHPMDLWKAMVEINLRGFLLVNGRLMTGVPLAILWILETLLLLVIPLYRVALNARKPYVEGKGCWLTEEEEIVITYVQDYRTMRRALLKQEYSGLSALDYHVLEGQESHGVLTFYRRRDYTGPYITLANVKAIQAGPKKIRHRFVPIVRLVDIGEETAAELYARLHARMMEEESKDKEKATLTGKGWKRWFIETRFNLRQWVSGLLADIRTVAAVNQSRNRRMGREERGRLRGWREGRFHSRGHDPCPQYYTGDGEGIYSKKSPRRGRV